MKPAANPIIIMLTIPVIVIIGEYSLILYINNTKPDNESVTIVNINTKAKSVGILSVNEAVISASPFLCPAARIKSIRVTQNRTKENIATNGIMIFNVLATAINAFAWP